MAFGPDWVWFERLFDSIDTRHKRMVVLTLLAAGDEVGSRRAKNDEVVSCSREQASLECERAQGHMTCPVRREWREEMLVWVLEIAETEREGFCAACKR